MSELRGTRLEHVADLLSPGGTDGGYCPVVVDGRRTWMARTPSGHLGNLGAHEVTEHADGTITVHPSILVSDSGGELFHGWLIAGTWTW